MTPEPDSRGSATAPTLESLATRAVEGDGAALAALVEAVQDDVYRLSLRMLWHPQDAEDATQEIALKIVTSVATFRGESAFRTWALRVATNHLLNIRRSRIEERGLTFDAFGSDLLEGLEDVHAVDADQSLLVEEVKIGCTQAMLLCLDRDERIAYILGDVFELHSVTAGEILGIGAAAFRKRLSRARERLRDFMRAYCGLLNRDAPCACARRVAPAVRLGRVDPARLLFAGTGAPVRAQLPVLEAVAEMEGLHEMAAVHQSHPEYAAPQRVRDAVSRIIQSTSLRILRH